MSATHDYPVRHVHARDLDGTCVLVGESGGLSAVYEVEVTSFGVVVQTEHGTLQMHPFDQVAIYDSPVDDTAGLARP